MVFRFIRKIDINYAWNFAILMVAKISLKTTRFQCSDLRLVLVCYSPLNLDSNTTYFIFVAICFRFNTKLTGLLVQEGNGYKQDLLTPVISSLGLLLL